MTPPSQPLWSSFSVFSLHCLFLSPSPHPEMLAVDRSVKSWQLTQVTALLAILNFKGVRYFSVIEGGIAQAVPEHPKRENIFSLSTAFGDAYLFQVVNHFFILLHGGVFVSLILKKKKINICYKNYENAKHKFF